MSIKNYLKEKVLNPFCHFWREASFLEISLSLLLIIVILLGIYRGPDRLQNTILLITVWAVLWYTGETRRLRELTAKQIEISIQPLIVVASIGEHIDVKNIGKSPALCINIHDIAQGKYIFRFEEVLVGEIGGNVGIPFEVYNQEGSLITSSEDKYKVASQFLSPHNLQDGKSYNLVIDYDDIKEGKWRTTYAVYGKRTHYKGTTKRDN